MFLCVHGYFSYKISSQFEIQSNFTSSQSLERQSVVLQYNNYQMINADFLGFFYIEYRTELLYLCPTEVKGVTALNHMKSPGSSPNS